MPRQRLFSEEERLSRKRERDRESQRRKRQNARANEERRVELASQKFIVFGLISVVGTLDPCNFLKANQALCPSFPLRHSATVSLAEEQPRILEPARRATRRPHAMCAGAGSYRKVCPTNPSPQ